MPTYRILVLAPTGPIASETVEGISAIAAAMDGLGLAHELLGDGLGSAKLHAGWRVQVMDVYGDVLADMPIGSGGLPSPGHA